MALIFSSGDYSYYEYSSSIPNSVAVMVQRPTKTSYEDIPATIEYNNITYTVVSLYVPETIASTSAGCFSECTNLTIPPSIPDTVINMEYAFDGCTNLIKAPIIPDSVTNLDYAFKNCTSLKEVLSIPTSVVDISNAFTNCTKLSGDIIAYGAPPYPDNASGIFDGTREKINILVPTQELHDSWIDIIDTLEYDLTRFSVTLVEDTPAYSKAVTRNDLKTILQNLQNVPILKSAETASVTAFGSWTTSVYGSSVSVPTVVNYVPISCSLSSVSYPSGKTGVVITTMEEGNSNYVSIIAIGDCPTSAKAKVYYIKSNLINN